MTSLRCASLISGGVAPLACRRWWSAAGLLIFGACVRLIVSRYFEMPLNSGWLYRFAPSEMMMFGASAVAYFIGRRLLAQRPALTTALCVGFVLALAFVMFFTEPTGWLVAHSFGGGISASLMTGNYDPCPDGGRRSAAVLRHEAQPA